LQGLFSFFSIHYKLANYLTSVWQIEYRLWGLVDYLNYAPLGWRIFCQSLRMRKCNNGEDGDKREWRTKRNRIMGSQAQVVGRESVGAPYQTFLGLATNLQNG
jgi:hypothetical protein